MRQQYDYIHEPYLQYVVVSSTSDALTEHQNDSVLLLNDSPLQTDEQGLPFDCTLDYLQRCIGKTFQRADAIFIIADFSDKRSISLTSCLSFILSQQIISHQSLLISIVNETKHFKPETNRQQFEQGLNALQQYCNTLIVNAASDIERRLLQALPPVNRSFPPETQAIAEVFSLFAISFWYPSLIGVDFADIYPLVSKTIDSVFVSVQGVGEDGAALAANQAVSQLQQKLGKLSSNNISIVVNVCGANLLFSELETIGDILCSKISEIADIKIVSSIAPEITKNTIVVRVLVSITDP